MDVSNIEFSAMMINFSDGRSETISSPGTSHPGGDVLDLGVVGSNTKHEKVLRWATNGHIIFGGRVSCESETEIQVCA